MESRFCQNKIGVVRLKIRELAAERSWTIKEVAERAKVNYKTVKIDIGHPGMNMGSISELLEHMN